MNKRKPALRRGDLKVLVVDVGGTNVKVHVPGLDAPRKIRSGRALTARRMVSAVKRVTDGAVYDRVSIGYPGPVLNNQPLAEPRNLGGGWVAFDYRKAFKRPVIVVNDAVLQALGSYRGGRMLFLGLGTGLGTTLIVDGVLAPMELAHLPYLKGRSFEDYVGLRGLERLGRRKWRKHVADVAGRLRAALLCDDVVIGGGNARHLKKPPAGARLVDNAKAFVGGERLWNPRVPGERPASRSSRRPQRRVADREAG